MPCKDATYDNGFTERFYYNDPPLEEAKRMARINRVAKFRQRTTAPGLIALRRQKRQTQSQQIHSGSIWE